MTTSQFSASGAPETPGAYPLPDHFPGLRLKDPTVARQIAAVLLEPLADPTLDPNGSLTLWALEVAASYLQLATREQRRRVYSCTEDARRCEQDWNALHDWRRLDLAETFRLALHDLSGRQRGKLLEKLAELYPVSEDRISIFADIASSLDRIRQEDGGDLPEIE